MPSFFEKTDSGATEFAYTYDAAGNRQSFTDANGTTTNYEYDNAGRVIRAEVNGVTSADWQYDAVGNILTFRTFNSSGNIASTTTRQYHENNVNFSLLLFPSCHLFPSSSVDRRRYLS